MGLKSIARRLLGCDPAPLGEPPDFFRAGSKPSDFYTVEMFVDISGSYRWRIRHLNDNVLATSEAYSSRGACRETAERLAREANFAYAEITA